MARNKPLGKKIKLISRGKRRPAPRGADIRKFGPKRARTRRVQVKTKRWRRDSLKV